MAILKVEAELRGYRKAPFCFNLSPVAASATAVQIVTVSARR
jgi:hypothetical protein